MKKTNNKILVLAISLALLVCSIVGITVSAQTENVSEPSAVNAEASLSIYKKNVSFQNAPQLVFAVAYENCDPADITLEVWYSEKSGEAQTVSSFGSVTIDGENYPAFAVNPADPKDLDKQVYVQAKAGDVVSEVERYSILEFAWSGIMTAITDEDAADYYNIIDYSKSVQKWLAGKFNGTPVGNYFYVKADGITLDASGYDSGIFTSPVTFTLGESALGWSVTTYANGTKTTETKAAGTEITASASTICTKIETPEPVKPQKVDGARVDFENVTIDSSGNGVQGTTEIVGSSLTTADKGIIETTDNSENTTKAYYFDSNKGAGDRMRFQAAGSDADNKLTSANAFIFESDIKFDYADGASGSSATAFDIYLGSSGTGESYAYRACLYYYANTNEIKMEDVGFAGTSSLVSLGVGDNEWFKLRIEYYKISADEILTLIFVNGDLKFTSNRCLYNNGNDDNAWPVYSDAYTTHKGKTLKGVDSIFFNAQSSTDATVYFDNSIVRRTTLTPPIITVEDYDSYYNSTN